MNLISQPPRVHTAFNPALLELGKTSELDGSGYIFLRYFKNGVDTSFQLSRDMYNDLVQFDVSPTVKRFFYDKRTDIFPGIFTDSNLAINYDLFVEYDRLSAMIPLVSVNAVVQIGEVSDLTNKQGTFLTTFDKLIKYKGYDLDIACLGFEPKPLDNESYIGIDGELQEVNEAHFCIEVPDNAKTINLANQSGWEELRNYNNEIITNDLGEPIFIRNKLTGYVERIVYVENRCTPINPFYVRWINQQGGRDYWMFSFRQEKTREVQNLLSYNKYMVNQQIVKGTTKIITLEGVEQVTIGAAQLSPVDYNAVSKIIYSPSTEYYSEKLGKWLDFTIDESKNSEDTYSATQSIELRFTLPKPQLQF